MYLIGLDIGTTGCKTALFSDDGALVASASREYSINIPYPNWAEQDAEGVWNLAQETLREVIARSGIRNVAAIGLSVQGEAIAPVDDHGRPMRPMILGMDTRTDPQNAWLRDTLGAQWLFEHTGMPVHTINTLPKLLWLKVHQPDLWASATRFMLYEDFLIHKMTGQVAVSQCLASRTQLYDLRGGQWSESILEALELDPVRLAPVQRSGTPIGPMLTDLSSNLGFSTPPLVVTGGHDQACGALGVGLTRPGLAEVSTGTAEVMIVSLSEPALNVTLYEGNISVYAHVVPGLYVAMTLNHSGGLLLRWFRDTFCQEESIRARTTGVDPYDLILQHASPGPTSLLILPHFAGSGTPMFDTASKGAILGLTFATTKSDLAKAVLEGLTFELRVNFDVLRAGGVQIDELRAIGGGARSRLWVQLKADVLGVPVTVPRVTDAACWGAALLAGVGAGCYRDLVSSAEALLHLDTRYVPDPARQRRYAERFALYREVYPAVADIHHRL
jgi:xylulokinase